MKVLVVDDEAPIAEALAYNLRKEGHLPLVAGDGEQCLAVAREERPDLVLLDVMLPSGSGFDVCRKLRKESDVPIIMLTARAEEMDRVVGLELGADDYVTKPFSMRELMARVKSVLRRSAVGGWPVEGVLHRGDLTLDVARHEVKKGDAIIDLSPKEFELLSFLMQHPGRAFARETLLDRVWGADAYVGERTVDVHVRWLREKVEENPARPKLLLTIRGVGYKLASE
jgi:phosphate regulon transcriptional regulator PhoB